MCAYEFVIVRIDNCGAPTVTNVRFDKPAGVVAFARDRRVGFFVCLFVFGLSSIRSLYGVRHTDVCCFSVAELAAALLAGDVIIERVRERGPLPCQRHRIP